MKSIRLLGSVLGAGLVLCLSFQSPAKAATELVPVITPPPGGGAYILEAGIVTVSNKYLNDVKLVHEASTGTLDGFRRMKVKGQPRQSRLRSIRHR